MDSPPRVSVKGAGPGVMRILLNEVASNAHEPARSLLYIKTLTKHAMTMIKEAIELFANVTPDDLIAVVLQPVLEDLCHLLDAIVAPTVAFEARKLAFNPGSSYTDLLHHDALRRLHLTYPFLQQRLDEAAGGVANNFCKMLQRFKTDFQASGALMLHDLYNCVEVPEVGDLKCVRLLRVVPLGSDPHNGGERVLCMHIQFDSSDTQYKIVYKPRGAAAYSVLHTAMRIVGLETMLPPAFVPSDNGLDYHWQAFVPHSPVKACEDIGTYYRNCGRLLAIATVLGLHDCHADNIVACGDVPYIVDSEALFERMVTDSIDETPCVTAMFATGLVDTPPVAFHPYDGDFTSALQQPAPRVKGEAALRIDNDATLNMQVVYTSDSSPSFATSTPLVLAHETPEAIPGMSAMSLEQCGSAVFGVTVAPYWKDVCTGFKEGAELVSSQKMELQNLWDTPACSLRQPLFRVVLRPTAFYVKALWRLHQPDALCAGSDGGKSIVMDWLASHTIPLPGTVDAAAITTICDLEAQALMRGDIPIFVSSPLARDIQSGETAIGSALHEPFAFLRRLSFFSMPTNVHACAAKLTEILNVGEVDFSFRVDLPFSAHRLADTLLRNCQRELIHHLSLPSKSSRHESYDTLNVFDGIGGACIALELVRLIHIGATTSAPSAHTGTIYEDLHIADSVMKHMLSAHVQATHSVSVISGLAGRTSAAYTLAFLACARNNKPALDAACSLLRSCATSVNDSACSDILQGTAGDLLATISTLDAMAAFGMVEREMQGLLHLAKELGDVLLARNGSGANITPYITGFSHGYAGVAFALHSLWWATGAAKYRDCAIQLIAAENALFDASTQSWPRVAGGFIADDTDGSTFSWCHGTPGCLLARSVMLHREHEVDASATSAVGDLTRKALRITRGGTTAGATPLPSATVLTEHVHEALMALAKHMEVCNTKVTSCNTSSARNATICCGEIGVMLCSVSICSKLSRMNCFQQSIEKVKLSLHTAFRNWIHNSATHGIALDMRHPWLFQGSVGIVVGVLLVTDAVVGEGSFPCPLTFELPARLPV